MRRSEVADMNPAELLRWRALQRTLVADQVVKELVRDRPATREQLIKLYG